MLALQQHFAECAPCEAELRSLRELKRLLRALHQPQPRRNFPEAMTTRLAEADSPFYLWKTLFLLPARPQRGRRLATALALFCLTIFAVAAPFAPPSQDEASASWTFLRPAAAPAQTGDVLPTAMPDADVRPASFLTLTDTEEAQRERAFAGQYAQSAQPDPMAAPLADDAVRGYVQGDIAFAGYRTR